MPFGHTALTQLILHLLWNEKRYCRYLESDRKTLDTVVPFAGTVFHWALGEYSRGVFSPAELNVRDNHTVHAGLVQRVSNLWGTELDRYNTLVADIYARGEEMIGLSVDM